MEILRIFKKKIKHKGTKNGQNIDRKENRQKIRERRILDKNKRVVQMKAVWSSSIQGNGIQFFCWLVLSVPSGGIW